jgi:hypothetical protein
MVDTYPVLVSVVVIYMLNENSPSDGLVIVIVPSELTSKPYSEALVLENSIEC